MDFPDRLRQLRQRAESQKSNLETEEATKNALVMPFIQALGYDVFNPDEVIPEYTADHGVKRGEKVDYAICNDNQISILVECKTYGTNLNNTGISQLFRYFSVTKARIAILTNGTEYRLYSDLESPNKMDEKPFLIFDLLDPKDDSVRELKKLQRANFDENSVLESAGELKYTRQIKAILNQQMSEPTEEIVEALARQVYSGKLTQKAKTQFSDVVAKAFRGFVTEMVNSRLESAMSQSGSQADDERDDQEEEPEPEIVTTDEEREGFHIVRAILRSHIDVTRVFERDQKTYFGILLDDNNRKPLCRLHLNRSVWYIGLFDAPNRKEDRVQIDSLNDIYQYADRLRDTLKHYL